MSSEEPQLIQAWACMNGHTVYSFDCLEACFCPACMGAVKTGEANLILEPRLLSIKEVTNE